MSPKYVLFILPLIIIWIGIKIHTINNKIDPKKFEISLVILSIIFFLFNINNSPIDRPPTKQVINEIIKQKVQYIVSGEKDYVINYFKTKKAVVENGLIILSDKDRIPKTVNKFWFICLNNTRFAFGNKGLLINKPIPQKKCIDYSPSDESFVEILPIVNDTQDYLIRKFTKR